MYWYSIQRLKKENVNSTTRSSNDNTKFLEEPHSRKNISDSEIIDNIKRKKSFSFRGICIILAYIIPVYCLIQTPTLVINYEVTGLV